MWNLKRLGERDHRIVLSLSGRLEGEQLPDLQEALGLRPRTLNLVLDLKDLRLVDQASVNFLADLETRGATLCNCLAYVREWINVSAAATESAPEYVPAPSA